MGQLNIRIILCHILNDTSPQSRGIKDVCLINTAHLFAALPRNIKSLYRNAPNFIFIINECIRRLTHAIFYDCPARSEIQSAGQLTHDQHIEAIPDDLIAQRARRLELLIQIRRTKICKQVQRLAQLQKSCLRTLFRRKLIPGRSLRIAADGAHQHGILCLRLRDRLIRKRYSVHIDGRATHQKLGILQGKSIFFSSRIQHAARFLYNLRSDSVARNHSNFIVHLLSSFLPAPLSF